MKNDAETIFPFSAEEFLRKLSKNNNKEWFEKHRDEFELKLRVPAIDFVQSMGEKLRTIVPAIVADPRTDKSIFRLHRDTRFSKDKNPYKTNLGILFWEGERKRMECPGFYFHLEPGKVMLGAGIYMFAKDQIKVFRDAAADDKTGKELHTILKKLEKKGYPNGTKHYKKVPRGYDPQNPQAHLLLHNGLHTYKEFGLDEITGKKDLEKFVFSHFKEQLPLHLWLMEHLPTG